MIMMAGIYITELIKYILFLHFCLKEKVKRWWMGIVCVIPYISVMWLADMPIPFSAVLATTIALLLMTEKVYGKVIISVVFLDAIAEILVIFVRKVVSVGGTVISEEICYFITNILILLILLIYTILVKKFKVRKVHIPINFVYVILGIVAWVVILTIALLQLMLSDVKNKATIRFVELFVILGIVSVFILLFTVLYIYHMNERLSQAYAIEHSLKEAQEAYYHALLEKEEETRRYRHDISNHMMCLLELARSGRHEEMLDYIEGMNNQLKSISHKVYETGNYILDIVLNYYIEEIRDKIKVQVTGRILLDVAVDNLTLCTIFSNIIKNAVEEINQCQERNPVLKFHIESGIDNVMIEVQNTSRQKEIKDGRIKTGKNDRRNHGIGIGNVRKAVEENNGIFEVNYADGIFTAKVYLPYQNRNSEM